MNRKKAKKYTNRILNFMDELKLSEQAKQAVLAATLTASMYEEGWEKDEFLDRMAETWDLYHTIYKEGYAPKLRVVK